MVAILVVQSSCKEETIYEIEGGDLFDLIRLRKPVKPLKVTKVEGDKGNLRDGIYIIAEDELDDIELKKQPGY